MSHLPTTPPMPEAASEEGRVVAVTGATGYLGSKICAKLEDHGWRVLRLVRSPRAGDPNERPFVLGRPVAPDTLRPASVLVHTAYDFRARGLDSWRTNVDGTRTLLEAARAAGVSRSIVFSSMSAYPGTKQLYGRVKLGVEDVTFQTGGRAVRPGFVYGDDPGGIAGAISKLLRLPLVPLVAGNSHQFPVHDEDLVAAIVAMVEGPDVPPIPIGIAPPTAVRFRDVVAGLAAAHGRRPRLIPVPWRLLYWPLRIAEAVRIPLPLRSDSLIGLVRPAPTVPNPEIVPALGVQLRTFPATAGNRARRIGRAPS